MMYDLSAASTWSVGVTVSCSSKPAYLMLACLYIVLCQNGWSAVSRLADARGQQRQQ